MAELPFIQTSVGPPTRYRISSVPRHSTYASLSSGGSRGLQTLSVYFSGFRLPWPISRGLADKWLRLEECPPRANRTSRPGMAEDFREELWARWEQGQQEGKQLFAEIRQRGYVGSYEIGRA